MRAGIVCETGEARDVHHMACLIGYGAGAVYPYVAYDTCREILEKSHAAAVQKLESARKLSDPNKLADAETEAKNWGTLTWTEILKNYRKAIEDGLLKIMSKMGISVLASYQGAQIFEAIGIGPAVIERCFAGTASQVGGIGFGEIARESLFRHAQGYAQPIPSDKEGTPQLRDPGFYRFRRDGEVHAITPPVLKSLHAFVKTAKQEDYATFVSELLANRPLSLRDLTEFIPLASGPVPIGEVECIEDIRRRFTTAGMSLGALSPEAHECLAIAMNRIGGKSNSGEGGEDPERFKHRENGDLANSAIKQVASGRFGVNASYLASAKEIEIKMAQGSKPGEGGQLPGHKVSGLIAKLRHTIPGVMLISPPPHHDIYSIEDLAQLIYDLKQVNPRARICVKLVAEAGIGTIAAGVAKAHADIILISGHEGGTGASPLSSIKNAGSSWELGIAEAQQVLLLNGLRNRVTLRTDGGLRTGTDIVQAAILGAEEYNFGTIAIMTIGCVYVRQCHLNTCPVGIATQDERLRAKFKGSPENIINFFNGVAEEVRQIMARLGVRTLNELVGQTKSLRQRHVAHHPKANTLDLGKMLADVAPGDDSPRRCTRTRNDGPWDRPLDDAVLQDAKDAITDKTPMSLSYKVCNVNRSVAARVSGEIGYQRGPQGLPDGTLELKLEGSAGQSLGAFLSPGLRIVLEGEANDYVGKSMSGGEIIVRPPNERNFTSHDHSILGNTVLYGATGGVLFASGRAGERFAVRNSGAIAVVEGVGDHGCEYMTDGTVVVLGRTGRNFGAGMTGGVAYVLDIEEKFEGLFNPQLVGVERLAEPDVSVVQQLIYKHLENTESQRAKEILADWAGFGPKFWKVRPHPPNAKLAEAQPKAAAESGISEVLIATNP
jgi:glutamate synthase domain-containing protein 2/glutamate synthase domain-containing protein 3